MQHCTACTEASQLPVDGQEQATYAVSSADAQRGLTRQQKRALRQKRAKLLKRAAVQVLGA